MMKFSVLIPTRNRVENLKDSIASVLLQDYNDFEIIVSDNDSEQDIRGYLASLNDSRICYSRTEAFLSVTENWNRTIDQSTGDYVIMLGDDDCLMKGYFSQMQKLIFEYSQPDLIYSDALLYAHPGVLPNHPNGFLRTTGNCSYWKKSNPFYLNKEEADQFAEKTMSFKFAFSFNMQYATIHRSLIDKLRFKGRFFHSPYPDYYAMTLLLKKAEKVLVFPYPMTIIGISPKSFGWYYFNNKESEGMHFLNNTSDYNLHPELKRIMLPGSMMNNCWLSALTSLQKNYSLFKDFKTNFLQYRRLQIIKFFSTIRGKKKRFSLTINFLSSLYWWEPLLYVLEIPLVWTIRKSLGPHFLKTFQNRFLLQYPLSYHLYDKPYPTVLAVLNDLKFEESNGYITQHLRGKK